MAVKFKPTDPSQNIIEEIARSLGLPTPATLALMTTDPSTGRAPTSGPGQLFTALVRQGFDPMVAAKMAAQAPQPSTPGAPAGPSTVSRTAPTQAAPSTAAVPPQKQAPGGEKPAEKPPGKFRRGLQGIVSRTPAQYPFAEIDPREAPIITLAKGFANTLVAGARREAGMREEAFEERRTREIEERTELDRQQLALAQEQENRAAGFQRIQQELLIGEAQNATAEMIAGQPLRVQQQLKREGFTAESMSALLADGSPEALARYRYAKGLMVPEAELRIEEITQGLLARPKMMEWMGLQPGDEEGARAFARAFDPKRDFFDLMNAHENSLETKARIDAIEAQAKTDRLGAVKSLEEEMGTHLNARLALETDIAKMNEADALCASLKDPNMDPDVVKQTRSDMLQMDPPIMCPVSTAGLEQARDYLRINEERIMRMSKALGEEALFKDLLSGKKLPTTIIDPDKAKRRAIELIKESTGIDISTDPRTPKGVSADERVASGIHRGVPLTVSGVFSEEGMVGIADTFDRVMAEVLSGGDYTEDMSRVERGKTTGIRMLGPLARRAGRQINFLQKMFAGFEDGVALQPFVQRAMSGAFESDPRWPLAVESVTNALALKGIDADPQGITHDAAILLWYIKNRDGEFIPAHELWLIGQPTGFGEPTSKAPIDPKTLQPAKGR